MQSGGLYEFKMLALMECGLISVYSMRHSILFYLYIFKNVLAMFLFFV